MEPDARLAKIFAKALLSRNHTVMAATTAQDAVIAADEQQPDIVLLELQLTAHSGIEFLYEFRSYADWRQLPVIVVSVVPPSEFEKSRQLLYDRLGVAEYHYKPRTNLRTVLRSVERVLAGQPEPSDSGPDPKPDPEPESGSHRDAAR